MSHAQLYDRAGAASTPTSSSQEKPDRSSLGKILGGSALGVSAGMGTGLLLLKASAEIDPNGDRYDRGENPESEAAVAVGVIGLAAIVAGGPIGAVEIGGIAHRRRDAYASAGFGEAIVGMLGIALADQLHDSSTARLVGLSTGMVLGSAGGAYLVASREKKSNGLFSYRDGDWQVAPPNVRVRPHLMSSRTPSVGVALVSVEL